MKTKRSPSATLGVGAARIDALYLQHTLGQILCREITRGRARPILYAQILHFVPLEASDLELNRGSWESAGCKRRCGSETISNIKYCPPIRGNKNLRTNFTRNQVCAACSPSQNHLMTVLASSERASAHLLKRSGSKSHPLCATTTAV